MKNKTIPKKKMPRLRTDEEAEAFLMQDLRPYLHAENLVKVKFEFEPKSATVNLRMPPSLLAGIKKKAKHAKLPYQRYIRYLMEKDLTA